MSVSLVKEHKTFGGVTQFYQHDSLSTKTKMNFSTFLPCEKDKLDSALIWLSGLTCNEENFITKAGAQKVLAGTKTMLICPDTSPRGLELPGEHESYDFGSGASFYLNATTEGYKDHYQMQDYICIELVKMLKEDFGVDQLSLFGHSMGGHGALVLGLKNPELFKSVSAFSPVVNPTKCPWGQKAFKGYLGKDESKWKEYDATELIKGGVTREDTLLIDQGLADNFFEEQLLTKSLEDAVRHSGQSLEVKYREGFDHSYYYIASFVEEHIRFHLGHLR